MTAPDVRRRRFPVGELYVLLCAGLAVLVINGIAPTATVVALVLLMLPVAIVGSAVLLNVAFLDSEYGYEGWMSPIAFVVGVALLALLQVRVAHNWRATAEKHARPATATADTGT